MDGNGRWAERQGLPRIKGHQVGVERVEEIIRVAPELGVKYITLYAFSKENWQRPKQEVRFLMDLLVAYLDKKLADMRKSNVVFKTIGDLEDLPVVVQEKIERNKQETKNNTGLIVTFAFSYSSRDEIMKAARNIARKACNGELAVDDIDEETISKHLFTHDLPDPDLLVRTSGEMRISNFLLWQISYAELYVTETCWPDFTKEEFQKAIESFGARERRYGLTSAQGDS